jgi:hypothetical protein
MAAAVQAFELAALAIAEFQVHPLHPVRPGIVLGDAMDRRQPARHRRNPWPSRDAGAADAAMAVATGIRAIMRGCGTSLAGTGFMPVR